MRLGIIGMPGCGKTTAFNVVARAHAEIGAYQAKDEIHRAVVKVPDKRLEALAGIFKPKKIINAEIEYRDFAGLAGDKSDAQLLPPAMREVEALVLVLRAFGDNPDPEGEVRSVIEELIFADLAVAEKRVDRLRREQKVGVTEGVAELAALEKCLVALNENRPLRLEEWSSDEERVLRGYAFLSRKPLLAVINCDDDATGDILDEAGWATRLDLGPRSAVAVIRARLEAELAELDEDDRQEFMADYGFTEGADAAMVRRSYDLLGLISFFTGAEKECRAWAIPDGSTAPTAAGVIHTDFERGFIRAEVTPIDDLLKAGSTAAAKKAGVTRVEGREYVVRDGDYVIFLFNV